MEEEDAESRADDGEENARVESGLRLTQQLSSALRQTRGGGVAAAAGEPRSADNDLTGGFLLERDYVVEPRSADLGLTGSSLPELSYAVE